MRLAAIKYFAVLLVVIGRLLLLILCYTYFKKVVPGIPFLFKSLYIYIVIIYVQNFQLTISFFPLIIFIEQAFSVFIKFKKALII